MSLFILPVILQSFDHKINSSEQVYARVRSPHDNTTIVRAEVDGQHAGVAGVTALATRELVKITLTPPVVDVTVLVVLGAKPTSTTR